MTDRNLALGVLFLSQTALGLLGNSSVFYNYLLLYFTRYKLNSTDWMLNCLIVANFLTLLCKGVPQTLAAFGLSGFLSDSGCKLLFYFHKMGRGTCICCGSLISVFQAITISPRVSRWAEFTAKASKYSGFCLCLCCILNILTGANNLLHRTGRLSSRNTTSLQDFGYCSFCLDKTGQILHAVFLPLPDAVCVGLIVWTSIWTAFNLHEHKQRMQHMPRTKPSPIATSESRVIKTILLQLSTFVFFYIISCIFQLILTFSHNPSWFLVNTSLFISGCFPAFSPFLLMNLFSIASSHCLPWKRN